MFWATEVKVSHSWSLHEMEVCGQPQALTPGENDPCTHLLRGWVDPRAGMDATENGDLLPLPEIEPRPSRTQITQSEFLQSLTTSVNYKQDWNVRLCRDVTRMEQHTMQWTWNATWDVDKELTLSASVCNKMTISTRYIGHVTSGLPWCHGGWLAARDDSRQIVARNMRIWGELTLRCFSSCSFLRILSVREFRLNWFKLHNKHLHIR
jgi:hypothetical protein